MSANGWLQCILCLRKRRNRPELFVALSAVTTTEQVTCCRTCYELVADDRDGLRRYQPKNK